MRKTALLLLLLPLLTAAMAAANAGDTTDGHGIFTTGGFAVTELGWLDVLGTRLV